MFWYIWSNKQLTELAFFSRSVSFSIFQSCAHIQASGLTFIGPEPSLPISQTVVKTAIWDWACKQHHKCWQDLRTCRQTKEMIKDGCRRRERDLLRLSRQSLRLVIGVLMGHVCLNRHLSIVGLVKDPSCSQCGMAIESASHFLCQCDRYITLRQKVWGKPYLDPADIDHSTVKDLERFIKKSHRFMQTLA